MFPVTKEYLIRYRTEGNDFAQLLQTIIDKNTKKIVDACQSYLNQYASGQKPPYATQKPPYATDIDYLLTQLFSDIKDT